MVGIVVFVKLFLVWLNIFDIMVLVVVGLLLVMFLSVVWVDRLKIMFSMLMGLGILI